MRESTMMYVQLGDMALLSSAIKLVGNLSPRLLPVELLKVVNCWGV
jgi:hypothetical protein